MMGRNAFVRMAVVGLCAVTLVACGEQKTGPTRIGIMLGVPSFKDATDAFKQGMIEQGYVEGQTILFDEVSANGDEDAMAQGCERFVDGRVDLIFATTNGGSGACKKAIGDSGIPMVFAIVMNPMASGIVDSMDRPSGNVTGVRNALSEYVGKRVEILTQLAPHVKRVWIPITAAYPTTKHFLPPVERAARTLGLTLTTTELATPQAIIDYLAATPDAPFDAIMVPPNMAPQAKIAFDAIINYAAERNLPVIGNSAKNMREGCLFSYHVDIGEEGRIAARMADRILKDETRVPYPVVTGEPVLNINGRVAEILGLAISDDLRAFGTVLYE
ncbi:MAG: ABC transporter substrate-binding protein [Alphaproteobacteria bacterium]|nr:ABC transporter substrate-binding protein [Alphaproteobacteria bacterium]